MNYCRVSPEGFFRWVFYNHVCGISYKNIIWRHVLCWTSDVKVLEICCWFQSAKKCRWTEMNCGGAELGSYDQSMSFNVWFNPSGYKVFNFKIQRFSCFFRSFLVSSVVVCFLICLIKVNSACYWKLRLGLLKCLQANIDFYDLAFLL